MRSSVSARSILTSSMTSSSRAREEADLTLLQMDVSAEVPWRDQ